MNCLTDKQLQELIDVEVTSHQQELYEQHLSECQHCSSRYKEQKEWTELIKVRVLRAAPTITQVPDFKAPTVNSNRKLHRIPLWAKVAAVMIPAFCFWRISNKNEDQYLQTVYNDSLITRHFYESSVPVSNSKIIVVIDELGNPIASISQ